MRSDEGLHCIASAVISGNWDGCWGMIVCMSVLSLM